MPNISIIFQTFKVCNTSARVFRIKMFHVQVTCMTIFIYLFHFDLRWDYEIKKYRLEILFGFIFTLHDS